MSARKIEQDPPHIAAARARLMDEVCAALPPEAVYRQSPPMTDTPGTLEERLRRNAGWRNERHQCVTDPNLLTEAADEIASLRARVEALEGALVDLMSWFPKKPSDPEWRIKGGVFGADDAVVHARSLVEKELDT